MVVETPAGRYALACDLVYCRQNLRPDATEIRDVRGEVIEVEPVDYDPPYVPPGLHVDLAACYESVARLRERVGPDGALLGSHDPEVLGGP